MLERHDNRTRSEKWVAPCHHLIGNTGQSILVASLADHPIKLLRGHVKGRANDIDRTGPCRLKYNCDTEIGEKGLAPVIEENILRFEVAVNNVLLVGMNESLPNLFENGNGLIHR